MFCGPHRHKNTCEHVFYVHLSLGSFDKYLKIERRKKMYELKYVWKDCPESDVENYVLVGVFTQKKLLRKVVKKIRKKESRDKMRGKIYIHKIDLDRKINEWEER